MVLIYIYIVIYVRTIYGDGVRIHVLHSQTRLQVHTASDQPVFHFPLHITNPFTCAMPHEAGPWNPNLSMMRLLQLQRDHRAVRLVWA